MSMMTRAFAKYGNKCMEIDAKNPDMRR